ncbi:MAG: ABC transporter substrate-binding protein [Methylococcus sp.]
MNAFPDSLKRLGLAFSLILLAAATLLWSDRHSRHADSATIGAAASARIPVALLQHSSNPLLDETRQGILDEMAAHGFRDGETISLTIYNPEGDLPTGNLMAQKIAGGQDKLAISLSTVMLQSLASANRVGRVRHVFGAVTSPVGAGVGIKAMDSLEKPPYLTGIGTPQPVADIFRMAKRINPGLKTVGVVWNPAEVNSEICTQRARDIAAELGMTLLEAPVEQTKDVREAAESLVARGAEAFWTGGDATVNNAVDSLLGVAQSARIPVFSNMAGHARRGGLFDLGASYYEVGQEVGRIASDILSGADPASIPVRDFVPRRILLNERTRQTLRGDWRFDDTVRAQAAEIVLADGTVQPGPAARMGQEGGVRPPLAAVQTRPQQGRVYKVGVAYFAPEPGIDAVMAGLKEALQELGYEERRNLEFRMLHAQAEIAQIPTLGQVLDNSDADVILTLTTPVLQGAGLAAERKPVVFTYVSDPLAAGAGKSFTEHLPNVTGIGSMPPVEEMLALTRQVIPDLRVLGTLYNPSEANSVKVASVLRERVEQAGLKLEEIPINTTAEVVQAAQALVSRQVGAILSVGDNTFYQAFDAIAKTARDARTPLIIDQTDFLDHDALMVIGADYRESGRAAAEPLARVLNGVKPADIPFLNVSKLTVALNDKSAQRLGLRFPDTVRALVTRTKSAAAATTTLPTLDHRWKLQRILFLESPPAEDALRGMDEGFKAAGLVAGRDYEMHDASAQGDMSVLPALIDTAQSEGAELLIVLSTPTLQNALRKVKDIPIIFTFVANPVVAGAGQDNELHLPNVTGIYTLGPYAEMAELLTRDFPHYRRIGTLFAPAEDNSVYNKQVFEQALAERGLSLVSLPVSSPGELPDAAMALAAKPIDAIVQILDNQSSSGFTAIARAAARARKPLLGLTEASVRQGAAAALTMSYWQSGHDAALMAARVMRGESPGKIPFARPGKISLIVSPGNAEKLGMNLPDSLLQRADQHLGATP